MPAKLPQRWKKSAKLRPRALGPGAGRAEVKEVFMSKVWLITGSSRGFGRALAEAVLAGGDKLVATARKPAQLADLLERFGTQVSAVALDVTDARAADEAVNEAVDAFGRLDVLVNNAG